MTGEAVGPQVVQPAESSTEQEALQSSRRPDSHTRLSADGKPVVRHREAVARQVRAACATSELCQLGLNSQCLLSQATTQQISSNFFVLSRTDNSVKNRWNSSLKRKLKDQLEGCTPSVQLTAPHECPAPDKRACVRPADVLKVRSLRAVVRDEALRRATCRDLAVFVVGLVIGCQSRPYPS